jgi:hypothetical protein
MRSRIYARDKIENKDRRFGSAPHWFFAEFIVGGKAYPCAFTGRQIEVAKQRLIDNPEDVPPRAVPRWRRLLRWIAGR